MDLDTYLTTNILDTFAEPLGIRYHNVYVILVVVGVGVITPGTSVGLYVAIFMVVLGFKYVVGSCWVFASG